MTEGGIALTVVSVNLDATAAVLTENQFNDPASVGNRFVIVRMRAQNVDGSVQEEYSIDEFDFRLTSSSAIIHSPFEHSCGIIPEELSIDFFQGGTGEGNVCFQIGTDESDLILFYDPLFSFSNEGRRWLAVN